MKKIKLMIVFMGVLVVAGCTSYAGISQADKAGSYYIVTNTGYAGFIKPGIRLCEKTSGGSSELACRDVNIVRK